MQSQTEVRCKLMSDVKNTPFSSCVLAMTVHTSVDIVVSTMGFREYPHKHPLVPQRLGASKWELNTRVKTGNDSAHRMYTECTL